MKVVNLTIARKHNIDIAGAVRTHFMRSSKQTVVMLKLI